MPGVNAAQLYLFLGGRFLQICKSRTIDSLIVCEIELGDKSLVVGLDFQNKRRVHLRRMVGCMICVIWVCWVKVVSRLLMLFVQEKGLLFMIKRISLLNKSLIVVSLLSNTLKFIKIIVGPLQVKNVVTPVPWQIVLLVRIGLPSASLIPLSTSIV